MAAKAMTSGANNNTKSPFSNFDFCLILPAYTNYYDGSRPNSSNCERQPISAKPRKKRLTISQPKRGNAVYVLVVLHTNLELEKHDGIVLVAGVVNLR